MTPDSNVEYRREEQAWLQPRGTRKSARASEKRVGPVWTVLRNLRWGAGWGLSLASLFSLYVFALSIIRGSAPFDRHGISPAEVIQAYLVGGVVAGALIGLLRPLTRWGWGAALLGLIASIPIVGLIGLALHGPDPSSSEILAQAITAVLLGPSVAFMLWRQLQRPTNRQA
jgi:hypothetical protein